MLRILTSNSALRRHVKSILLVKLIQQPKLDVNLSVVVLIADPQADIDQMFVSIPYKFFKWQPPELSASQRIEIGHMIAKVGRDAFVASLTSALLSSLDPNKSPISIFDVLRDAKDPPARVASSMRQKLIAGAFFISCFTLLVATGLITMFVVVTAVIAPITFGSLWWTGRKIERWAQDVLNEYAQSHACEMDCA
jgi:hypothetical protein